MNGHISSIKQSFFLRKIGQVHNYYVCACVCVRACGRVYVCAPKPGSTIWHDKGNGLQVHHIHWMRRRGRGREDGLPLMQAV